jgi:hypothetical protein
MVNWTSTEIELLKENYLTRTKRQLLMMFNGRTWTAKRKNGYILVRAKDYPQDWRGRWKDDRIYEHNLIWWLCNPDDPILQDEVIHHKDENRSNNCIENLEKLQEDVHGYFTKKGVMPEFEYEVKPQELSPEITSIQVDSILEEACRNQIKRELEKEKDDDFKQEIMLLLTQDIMVNKG